MTSMVDEMVSIISENPQLFSGIVPLEVQKIAAVNRVLDSLLVGLIPLKCRVVDYRAVDFGGRKLLVHNELLAKISGGPDHGITDAYIAGVTEQRLFWKDVRRVLFSGLQFRVMCRANGNGLQETWVPVKQQFAPLMGNGVDDQMKEAMIGYGLTLAVQCGGHLDRDDLEDTVLQILNTKPNFQDIEARREAFTGITQRVSEALGGVAIDPMLAAELRAVATIDAGVGFPGGSTQVGSSSNQQIDKASSIMDVEIVAIYW
jgi:hypothetical protein